MTALVPPAGPPAGDPPRGGTRSVAARLAAVPVIHGAERPPDPVAANGAAQ